MRKLNSLALLIMLTLVYIHTPNALALDASYQVMPGEGTATQPILIWVRVDPLIDSQRMYLYVFWDKIPVITRQADITLKGGGHEHRWDITIIPPETKNCRDDHNIEIWIETEAGNIKTLKYQYTITDGLPPLKWWQTLPQVFLDEITGPQGPNGPQGNTGQRGAEGKQGLQGPAGITGPLGTQGLTGEQGIQGERGPQSETTALIPIIAGSSILTGIVSIVASVYILRKGIKEERGS